MKKLNALLDGADEGLRSFMLGRKLPAWLMAALTFAAFCKLVLRVDFFSKLLNFFFLFQQIFFLLIQRFRFLVQRIFFLRKSLFHALNFRAFFLRLTFKFVS